MKLLAKISDMLRAPLGRISAGTEFTFDLGDDIVSVWGSWVTGREIVRVNETIVSDVHSFRFRTTHDFDVRGVPYSAEIFLAGALNYHLECRLIKDGTIVDEQHSIGIDRKTALRGLAVVGIIGVIAGYVLGYSLAETLDGARNVD